MQKNNKKYSFLLSHTTKSKIYIRRIEVSKKLLNSSIAIFILSLGIVSLGIVGFTRTNVLAKSVNPATNETAAVIPQNNQNTEPKSIDYSRPAGSENFAMNSGGPVLDLQLTKEEVDNAESGSVQDQIRTIAGASNP